MRKELKYIEICEPKKSVEIQSNIYVPYDKLSSEQKRLKKHIANATSSLHGDADEVLLASYAESVQGAGDKNMIWKTGSFTI